MSQTAPSTPRRTGDTRLSLPPQLPLLPDLFARQARSVSRSTPGSRSRSRSRSRSTHVLPVTPTRRGRRRSSLIVHSGQTLLDRKYVGGITVDYLRMLCQVLMKERQQTHNEDELEYPESSHNYVTSREVTPPPAEFDHSLPLPDTELGSPINDSEEIKPPRPQFKSYLERILEKQRLKSKPQAAEPPEEPPSERALDQHFSIRASYTTSDITQIPISAGQTENELESSQNLQPEPVIERSLELEESPQQDYEVDLNEIALNIESDHESNLTPPDPENPETFLSESQIVTPAPTYTNDDINAESISPEGVLREQYTFDDEQAQDTNEIYETFEPEPELNTPQPQVRSPIKRKPRSTVAKAASDVPLVMVKNLVQTVATGPLRKKRRIARVTPDENRLLREMSEEFLQSVVTDLEAYAEHRHSKTISMRDVILFLNRIRGLNDHENEIQAISKIAQDFLPLELLISLDNSLSDVVDGKKRPTKKEEDFESEYSDDLETTIRELTELDTFSESDDDV